MSSESEAQPIAPPQASVENVDRSDHKNLIAPSCIVAALVAVALLFSGFAVRVLTASESGVVMKLPVIIGNLIGVEEDVTVAEKNILPPDTGFAKRVYRGAPWESITCQIVLAGVEKRSIHKPEYCLPGQGWNVKSTEVIPFKLKGGGILEATRLTITRPVDLSNGKRAELTSYYYYWFVGKNYSTPSHIRRQFQTMIDRVFHQVNHRWAYIIVTAPVMKGFQEGGLDAKQTDDELRGFISELAPKIMKSLGAKEDEETPKK